MSRILVIDDELPLRLVLRTILEQAGHTVLDAPDGCKGMALWRREPTDIVVTDIFMPEKDGIEVILELRNAVAKPKIIAISGGGRRGLPDWNSVALALGPSSGFCSGGNRCLPDWDSVALSLGADRVLVKPFDQKTFLFTVQEVLGGLSDTQDAVLPSSATDQRKYPRLPVFLPVSFGNGLIAQTGTVVDISREGCRIQCAGAVPEMKYFRVEIQRGDPYETLTVDLAVMRWSRHGEFGVEFIRMKPDHQARLRSVIRNCEEALSRQDRDGAVQRALLAVSLGKQTEGQS